MISLLFEAGLVQQSGMGVAPLSWQELTKWADRFYKSKKLAYKYEGNGVYVPYQTDGNMLSDWELLTLKSMSEAYASEYNQASDKTRPAPYVFVPEDVDEDIDRVAIGNKLKSLFRSLKKQ